MFPASELAVHEEVERQAAITLQNAIEEKQRLQKTKISKGGVDTPSWSRERYEEWVTFSTRREAVHR
jgi:hypothetical protein